MNTDLLQTDLNKITPRLFEEAAFLAFYNGIESRAPLGFRGPDIYLFGSSRQSEISVCNYSGMVSMLITDAKGKFLSYGHINAGLEIQSIGEHLYGIFKRVRPFVLGVAPTAAMLISER